mmetsp:Transcript_49926/g.116559  ORF Transcript_49926/g.116559 Transcript_49926/m.116559 type:complete len:326 (-) Transcript_49926:799-1776(-)
MSRQIPSVQRAVVAPNHQGRAFGVLHDCRVDDFGWMGQDQLDRLSPRHDQEVRRVIRVHQHHVRWCCFHVPHGNIEVAAHVRDEGRGAILLVHIKHVARLFVDGNGRRRCFRLEEGPLILIRNGGLVRVQVSDGTILDGPDRHVVPALVAVGGGKDQRATLLPNRGHAFDGQRLLGLSGLHGVLAQLIFLQAPMHLHVHTQLRQHFAVGAPEKNPNGIRIRVLALSFGRRGATHPSRPFGPVVAHEAAAVDRSLVLERGDFTHVNERQHIFVLQFLHLLLFFKHGLLVVHLCTAQARSRLLQFLLPGGTWDAAALKEEVRHRLQA